jgi:hypothetical protein
MFPLEHVHVKRGKKIKWTMATARQNLPTLVALAVREPQEIYRRHTLVARVVSPDTPDAVLHEGASSVELLAQLQRVCGEESYELPVVLRVNRPNAFVDAVGTKRTQARTHRPTKAGR